MASYIVRIVGKDQALGRAEIDALLAHYDSQIQITWNGRIAHIEADINPIQFLLDRAALLREAGVVLLKTRQIRPETRTIPKKTLKKWVLPHESFSVRVIISDKTIEYVDKHELEINLGRQIQLATGATVSLDQPDTRVTIFLGQATTTIAKTTKSLLRKQLAERRPGRKQFFHPSMMNSQLARVMCNLARVMPSEVVLDPFCGGGGILCELASLGAVGVGIDLSWSLLTGAKTNLEQMRIMRTSLIQGDARKSPFCYDAFDAIVTDPPYGRSSSTRGADAIKLTESLIEQAPHLLSKDGRLCICGSSEMQVPELIQSHNMQLLGDYKIRVHSGLTRHVVVSSA